MWKYILINPLNAKINPICHFLALLGAHPILHVSRIRTKAEQATDEKYNTAHAHYMLNN